MNILLLGYGKMGRIIGEIAESRGHYIVGKINIENRAELSELDGSAIDVAIEFSQPDAAFENISWAINRKIPVVSGTTGWLDKIKAIESLTIEKGTAFFYASNFSVGVNIFFRVNRFLADLMKDQTDYKVSMEEIHHTEKKDAPSGTAITLAEAILEENPNIKKWKTPEDANLSENELIITSKRVDPAPGTHIIRYESDIDTIEICHTAHSRKGFAQGAVLVAEWIKDKNGVLSMDDFLSF
jgi:4-hydroxy-tetrahydrodipicolinate reductase